MRPCGARFGEMELGGVGRVWIAFVAGTLLARPLVKASEPKGFFMSRALAMEPFKAMVMLDLVVAILTEGVLGFVSLSRAQVLAEGTTLAQRYYRLSSVVGRSVMGFTLGVDSLGLPKKRGDRSQDARTGEVRSDRNRVFCERG